MKIQKSASNRAVLQWCNSAMHGRQHTVSLATRYMTTRMRVTMLLLIVTGLLARPQHSLAQSASRRSHTSLLRSSQMEEVGTLEIEVETVSGRPQGGNRFFGNPTEFEYGISHWWTTEFYVDWQHTRHEGKVFTGLRLENRFSLLPGDHWIKPVLYVEYEHLNGADKTLKEIVGFDGQADLATPNSEAREEREHEIETRVILSGDFKSWDLSGNFLAEKNLHGDPWEFGYSVGLSRPLASPSGKKCAWCREAFSAGVELYGGGLGTWSDFTLSGTSPTTSPLCSRGRCLAIRLSGCLLGLV